ncbi:hypothetical protein KAT92_06590, partial [Candidatus Babeliales bacterium]|nr:hypothetical protein [Candidatus Babeliales bacterium]
MKKTYKFELAIKDCTVKFHDDLNEGVVYSVEMEVDTSKGSEIELARWILDQQDKMIEEMI